jgi:predicted Zn-dependent protease
MCGMCASRRSLLGAFAALALAGCTENAATGRKQLVLVDDAQLADLADASWREMAAKVRPVGDPAVQARLSRIGGPLVAASGRTDLNWSFTVLDSPDLNAFVLPNGRMQLAGSDDELASVLGHEIGHIVARHPAERVSQELAVNAGVSIVQMLIAGEAGEYADEIAGALGMGAVVGVLLPYSRDHELEADRLGVNLMREVGRDPRAAIRFWQRMTAAAAGRPKPPEVISTHPADDRRMAALEAAIRSAPT